MRGRYSGRTLARELLMIALALAFCVPFYFIVTVSLKPAGQVYTSPLKFPADPAFGNFTTVWNPGGAYDIPQAMVSSLIITIGSVVVLVIVGSLCAYVIARRPSRTSTLLYFFFLLGIVIPFQLGILPLYVLMRHLGLVGSYLGMILLWVGFGSPFTVFLYTGFVRTLPRDYEEAARVDGAGLWRIYLRVVFPLLRPVTGTVAILMSIVIWNDFFYSLIFFTGSHHQPLPVAVYSFVGEYADQWNLIFAVVAISLLPILLFFLFAQRQLIRGFAGGIRG